MKPAQREEFFARLSELDPDPKTELDYSTPFELLVAVVLSAQSTDVGVNKATRRLFPVANTPRAILDLGEDGLKGYIQTLGLYNSKAANLVKACRMLVEQHDGNVPDNRADLEALPGVGRKTANVILNTADPARPLYLQGTQAAVRWVPGTGPVRVQGQEPGQPSMTTTDRGADNTFRRNRRYRTRIPWITAD